MGAEKWNTSRDKLLSDVMREAWKHPTVNVDLDHIENTVYTNVVHYVFEVEAKDRYGICKWGKLWETHVNRLRYDQRFSK